MKRIAFSVWPGHKGNQPKPEIVKVNERSKAVLAGFEHVLVTDFEPFDECSQLLFDKFHSPYSIKDYTNWSDYIRVVKILEFLESGYDEVLYFDFDLLIFEKPNYYGCAIEGHFEGPDREMLATEKFWFRGVNCTYYVNKSHVQHIKNHLTSLQEYIRSCNGSVKHCYPMNHLSHIEEEIGYVDGFYLFGSMDDPGFCTREKSLNFVKFAEDFMDDDRYHSLKAVNMMGSKKNSQEGNIDVYEEMREYLKMTPSTSEEIEKIKEVIRNVVKPLRVNYGSTKMRNKLKVYLGKSEENESFTLMDF